MGTSYKPLYNGNISSMTVNIGKLNAPMLYAYTYDQLNRITGMDAFNGLDQGTNDWQALSSMDAYQERVSYDANGNILTYLRKGEATNLNMDDLTYHYNLDGQGRLLNNRLDHVSDAVTATQHAEDIDDENAGNYTYDEIGNLIHDTKENIDAITWTVYGKIDSIIKTTGTKIHYTYDAAGNRISKAVTESGTTKTTWYVRDASGNVMATYSASGSSSSGPETHSLVLSEQHIYGSSRLGILSRNVDMKTAYIPSLTVDFIRGVKSYELSNHLGNVLVTISDKKVGHDAGNGNYDYFEGDVVTANDYYPFGMMMPGRKYTANDSYRYGFNGKENDNEVKGEGNQQDYGERVYDTRLGRFLSVDPLGRDYPELTPYQFASNTPIRAVDLDGLEAGLINYGYRVTAIFVTGSVSIGAAIDYNGNFKLFTQWSAGLGGGAFAGGGTSFSIYPTATADQVMGSGLNVGGNVGLPGISLGLDLNVSFQQNKFTRDVTGAKLGISAGVKLGSLGPGGVEGHIDYSSATPFLEFNLSELSKTELISRIKNEIDDSWFLDMTDEQINNFVDYMYAAQAALKDMFDSKNNTNSNSNKPAATTQQQSSQSTQQKPVKQKQAEKKTEKNSKRPKVAPKKKINNTDSTKKTTKLKVA